MKTLFLTLSLSLVLFTVKAQKLIADETYIYHDKYTTVVTYNETIKSLLVREFKGKYMQWTNDEKIMATGVYKCYTFKFNKIYNSKLISFFNKINK